ncbi:hypothetical protein ACH4YO_02325 [Streptomyces noursei]|uniref:hypothetical protein n=1 Tax=Streptomyces noursei TaxID=1971 RepID=UPI0009A01986
MRGRRTTMTAALAALALAGSVAAGAPSYAAGSTAPAATATAHAKGPKGDGAKALCRRVPKLEKRIEKRITRMEAGAGTRGSITYLEQRIANAKKADHQAIATFLGDRLTTRKTLLPLLKQKQTDLKAVATWCGTHHNGTSAAAS